MSHPGRAEQDPEERTPALTPSEETSVANETLAFPDVTDNARTDAVDEVPDTDEAPPIDLPVANDPSTVTESSEVLSPRRRRERKFVEPRIQERRLTRSMREEEGEAQDS